MIPRLYPFTVILLYPGYMTDGKPEAYLAHVQAREPLGALKSAQYEAARANGYTTRDCEDFKALAVFEGHQKDIKK